MHTTDLKRRIQLKNMKTIIRFIVASGLFLLASCTTPLREITYLNNLPPQDSLVTARQTTPYQIRPNDNLYINVISSNPQAASFLNLANPDQNYSSDASIELITYIVDNNGNIFLPYIGKIHAEDKTVAQLRTELQEKVNKMLANSSVVVKLVNRTVTVLGDVNRPGQYTMRKNNMTVFEALGLAGDLNDFGNRKKVQLIRKNGDQEKVTTIDLTNAQLLASADYYVQPNDVIYIPPKHRIFGAKTLPFTTLFTTISTAVLLYTAFSK